MVFAVAVVTVVVLRWHGVAGVRTQVAAAGAWAPLLFVLLQVVVTITPLPRTVFSVAAGVLFGSLWGLVLTIAGTMVAALAAYGLVRWFGAPFVERHAHRMGFAWVRARLDHSGLLAVLSLRLMPVMPFWVLNYAAGVARVRLTPYLLGTALGVLPGTIAVVVLGDAVTSGQVHPALLAVSVAGAVLGTAGAAIVAQRGPAPEQAPGDDPAPTSR